MRKRTAKQLGTRHDLNYFKSWTPRRRWLAGLAILLPVIFLSWLGLQSIRGESAPYSSGKLSRAHAFLGKQCGTCHSNFVGSVRVGGFRKHAQDQACLTCHEAPIHHADQKFAPACGTCHTEHVGSPQLARTSDQSCVQCHSDLQTTSGPAHFEKTILGFGKQHPEFAEVKTPDKGTIAFNHAVHLKANLLGPPGPNQPRVQLECADCHRPRANTDGPWHYGSAKWRIASATDVDPRPSHTAGQELMGPVTYDKHCVACHTLPFDKRVGDSVPHDKPPVVDDFVKQSLTAFLKTHPTAWRESEAASRRIPESAPAATQASSADEWLRNVTAEDESLLWRKTCKQCHETAQSTVAAEQQLGLPRVLPADMRTRWFTHAIFDHSAHAAVRCDSCHNQALTSTKTSDVLVPGIVTCRSCHSGSSNESAESGCFLCHQYHDWQQRKPFKPVYTIPQITGQD